MQTIHANRYLGKLSAGPASLALISKELSWGFPREDVGFQTDAVFELEFESRSHDKLNLYSNMPKNFSVPQMIFQAVSFKTKNNYGTIFYFPVSTSWIYVNIHLLMFA